MATWRLSATRISQHRLDDLLKEYEAVFPGVIELVAAFRDRPVEAPFGAVVDLPKRF